MFMDEMNGEKNGKKKDLLDYAIVEFDPLFTDKTFKADKDTIMRELEKKKLRTTFTSMEIMLKKMMTMIMVLVM